MTNVNMFIEPIIMKKKKHDLKAWIAKCKLVRKLNKTSPSFDMMVHIHEFLSVLRDVYMYDNNSIFHLFLAGVNNKNYNSRNTLAMIYKENGFSLKFVLETDSKKINIEITRNGQNRSDIERISFFDGQYEVKNIYDEEKMLFIISCLMSGVIELVDNYYKNKKL